MTTKKEVTEQSKENLLDRVNWLDVGIKVTTTVASAFVAGYVSAAASDVYQTRKAKKAARISNVLPMSKSA